MHSIYSRINNVSALLSSCMMALVALITVSSLAFHAEPVASLSVSSVKVYHSNTGRYRVKQQELAFVNFNISGDFTPLFNWNTKQVFLALEAEYTSADGVKNEVVIWDRIVRRKHDALVSVQGRNKYAFRDLSTSFEKVHSAVYRLTYHVMPFVGILRSGAAARTAEPVSFPSAQSRLS